MVTHRAIRELSARVFQIVSTDAILHIVVTDGRVANKSAAYLNGCRVD